MKFAILYTYSCLKKLFPYTIQNWIFFSFPHHPNPNQVPNQTFQNERAVGGLKFFSVGWLGFNWQLSIYMYTGLFFTECRSQGVQAPPWPLVMTQNLPLPPIYYWQSLSAMNATRCPPLEDCEEVPQERLKRKCWKGNIKLNLRPCNSELKAVHVRNRPSCLDSFGLHYDILWLWWYVTVLLQHRWFLHFPSMHAVKFDSC